MSDRTITSVRNQARKDALAIIAREHILTQRHLLDEIGKPLVLRTVDDPDRTLLAQIASDIVAALPDDLAEQFSEVEADEQHYMLASETASGGLLLSELRDPNGARWVAAVGLAGIAALEDDADLARIHELVNQCNVTSTGGGQFHALDHAVIQTYGAARKVEPGMIGWKRLVAQLYVDLVASKERFDGAPGPATRYQEFLKVGAASEGEPFQVRDIYEAALRYRASLPTKLANVIHLRGQDNGVLVTVPFRADDTTYALTSAFVVVDDEDPGLRVLSRFYKQLDPTSALTWCRAFNGDTAAVGADDDEKDTWPQTTPWTLGCWQLWELPQNQVELVFRGNVPNALHEFVDPADVIRGVVHEVWSSANRFRLHEEFEATIRGSHGTVQ